MDPNWYSVSAGGQKNDLAACIANHEKPHFRLLPQFVIMGGMCYHLLNPARYQQTDFDIFIVWPITLTEKELWAHVKEQLQQIKPVHMIIEKSIINFSDDANRDYSIVLRQYKTMEELFSEVDLLCTQVAYLPDDTFYYTPDFEFAFTHSMQIIDPTRRKINYEKRIAKYFNDKKMGIILPIDRNLVPSEFAGLSIRNDLMTCIKDTCVSKYDGPSSASKIRGALRRYARRQIMVFKFLDIQSYFAHEDSDPAASFNFHSKEFFDVCETAGSGYGRLGTRYYISLAIDYWDRHRYYSYFIRDEMHQEEKHLSMPLMRWLGIKIIVSPSPEPHSDCNHEVTIDGIINAHRQKCPCLYELLQKAARVDKKDIAEVAINYGIDINAALPFIIEQKTWCQILHRGVIFHYCLRRQNINVIERWFQSHMYDYAAVVDDAELILEINDVEINRIIIKYYLDDGMFKYKPFDIFLGRMNLSKGTMHDLLTDKYFVYKFAYAAMEITKKYITMPAPKECEKCHATGLLRVKKGTGQFLCTDCISIHLH